MPTKKPPLFIDLDETLIYAREPDPLNPLPHAKHAAGYEISLRPEASQILQCCRAGGREVYLFTTAEFGFAVAATRACGLGFDETTIFSLEMIARCRLGLSPASALIDNKPPSSDATRLKMAALGIPPSQVWVIPSYEPPEFSSARLFLLGLPVRLQRLEQAAIHLAR
jgi:hypothetical protein